MSAPARVTIPASETTSKTPRGTLYRGNEGMWSWVLHRITGVTIFFFLFVHVLDTAVIRVDPNQYDEIIETYKTPIIGLMEIALVACVLFHAFNGVRPILVDFWSKGTVHQRKLFWGVVIVWAVLMAGFLPRHLMHMFGA